MKNRKAFVKWARPYLKKKNVAAMTKKRAIKIIMAATCCGNRRWAEDMFVDAKSKIAGKPRNSRPEYEKSTSLMAHSIATQLKDLYGPGVGGKLIDDLEKRTC